MVLWLLAWFTDRLAGFADLAVLEKITSRAALAAVGSFLLAVVLGRAVIAWLRARFREPIKTASPLVAQLHAVKQWTPTMGGLFLVAGILASTAIFGDLQNPLVLIGLALTMALATLGAVDDLAKLRTTARGLRPRTKLIFQVLIAGAASLAVYQVHAASPSALDCQVPLVGLSFPLGIGFVPLAVLVIVGSSNAVNLTDGLDGLAGGCLLFALGAMGMLVYAAGHSQWADYLQVAPIPLAGEVAVLAAGALGAVLGFLWFNCFPASVFMGDTGSLPLGGLLGFLAIACRQEIVLILVGAVFVAEALSVILQVASCRYRGRRVLLCAPLHHHFQFLGWPENKIVVRFWIAGALAAIAGLGVIKLQARDPHARPIDDHVIAKSWSLGSHRK